MCRAFGAILIMISGLLLGILPLYNLMRRMQLLSELQCALEKMKAELHTNSFTIPQLMGSLNGSCALINYINDQMGEFGCMAFYDAWHDYAQHEKLLSNYERNVLEDLGGTLGRYVIQDQLDAFDRTIPVLKVGYIDTKNHFQKVSRLYIGTGMSLSLLLVILLL